MRFYMIHSTGHGLSILNDMQLTIVCLHSCCYWFGGKTSYRAWLPVLTLLGLCFSSTLLRDREAFMKCIKWVKVGLSRQSMKVAPQVFKCDTWAFHAIKRQFPWTIVICNLNHSVKLLYLDWCDVQKTFSDNFADLSLEGTSRHGQKG
jgi:hypothetical protein